MKLKSDNIANMSCGVGDKLKISRPIGYKPTTWASDLNEKFFLNGFKVIYTEIGEFEGSPDDTGNHVYYRHKKSGQQIIEFISKGLGTVYFYLVLEGVMPHDHASIPQGGPAYATYFSEAAEQIEEGS